MDSYIIKACAHDAVFSFEEKMAYSLRKQQRKNNRELSELQLPRAARARTKQAQQLYELEIVENDYTGRVKVHYTGYDSDCDEWRNKEDIVVIHPQIQGAL